MKKVITYGTFDLFHDGHRRLLERAKALGDYLIVGVTTDNFDIERGKMNTCNNVMDRIEAVRATGLADQIIIEEYRGQKIDDIQKFGVDIFTVGSDWEGYFDYLKEYCEVVYLPRTEGISSTMIREKRASVRIGIVGTGSIAGRFVPEAETLNSAVITSAYNPNQDELKLFVDRYGIGKAAASFDEMLDDCDAVYIASPYFTHYDYCRKALDAGKHVLCETPFALRKSQAEELFALAESKGLILMVAMKTAYCPAFGHLISLVKSGAIGDVVEINVSNTNLKDPDHASAKSRYGGSMIENAYFPLLPIFKFFGTDYRNINFYSKMNDGFDMFTKAVFRFDHAVASFQVGLGVKTEGNLIISGTKGYAYVPAPWWRTDYFEIRYEDQNQNKKYFYPYMGEGLRYEIKDFVSAVLSEEHVYPKLSRKEMIKVAEVYEKFVNGENLFII